jgi:hypothetical protein
MTTISKFTTPSAAGDEVDRRAELHMAAHGCGYREAWHATLAADPELTRVYAMPSSRVNPKPLRPRPPAPAPVQMAQGIPAAVEVDRRAVALTQEHPHLDYGEAMGRALAADPALKAAYAGMQ